MALARRIGHSFKASGKKRQRLVVSASTSSDVMSRPSTAEKKLSRSPCIVPKRTVARIRRSTGARQRVFMGFILRRKMSKKCEIGQIRAAMNGFRIDDCFEVIPEPFVCVCFRSNTLCLQNTRIGEMTFYVSTKIIFNFKLFTETTTRRQLNRI